MNKPKFTIDTYQKRYLEHLCEFLKMFKGSCAHNTPYHPTPLALTKITFRLWDNPWRLHGSDRCSRRHSISTCHRYPNIFRFLSIEFTKKMLPLFWNLDAGERNDLCKIPECMYRSCRLHYFVQIGEKMSKADRM